MIKEHVDVIAQTSWTDAVRRPGSMLVLLSLLVLSIALSPATARADFGDDFGFVPGSFFAGTCALPAIQGGDSAGVQLAKRDCHSASALAPDTATAVTQAGAHPDGTVSFEFKPVSTVPGAAGPYPDGNAKDISVDLPPGLVGNPEVTPKCAQSLLVFGACPISSQVGIVEIRLSQSTTAGSSQNPLACSFQPNGTTFPQFSLPAPAPGGNRCRFPIFNLVPAKGQTAAFGFQYYPGISILIVPKVRTSGDYGLSMTISSIDQQPAVSASTVTLWGVPGDPKHDPFRFRPISPAAFNILPGAAWPSDLPIEPFVTNPTSCDGSQPRTTIDATSWQKPAETQSAEMLSPPVTGCDQVPFDATAAITPTSTAVDSASGLAAEITTPQSSDPGVLGTANLKKTVVTLPEGVSVNPSASSGLEGCTDAQIALHSDDEPTCPDGSKVGTAEVTTPLLPQPDGPGTPNLSGDVFLGTPDCKPCGDADAASGRMLRLFLVLRNDDRGLLVKIAGSSTADPKTGRLVATFDDNPQVPFEDLHVQLKGGSHGVLGMPEQCGTAGGSTVLTPYTANGGGVERTSDSSFSVDGDCSGGFSPTLAAGMSSAAAGGSGTFTFDLARNDGQQRFAGLTATLPTGLLARVRDVPLCAEPQAAAGACPAASRVGTVTAGAGSGDPFYLPGTASLAGPYKGAPYSLVVAVPAVAGPFDLGVVVVRQALVVDPVDAHVTVVSDPFPTILAGVPLRIRRVRVEVDRPGFMVNPTDCSAKTVAAHLLSTRDARTTLGSPFQATGCDGLPLAPALKLQLLDSRQTRDGGHPGLEAVLTQRPGEANLRSAEVTLPLSMALDPDNAESDTLCSYEDGLKVNCPESSVIGTATAVSPLLKAPLKGKVYFVKNVRFNAKGVAIRTLPTLLIPLRGEVALDLRATSDVRGNALVNTFPTIPDAAISSFHLTLNGGKKGILVVTHDQDVCRGTQRAFMVAQGQNGKRSDEPIPIATPCPKAVTVAGAKVSGRSVRLTVSAPAAGTLRVRGAGGSLGTVTRKMAKAGKVAVTLRPTARGARTLASRGRLTVKVGVSFVPRGAKQARTASVTVTLRR